MILPQAAARQARPRRKRPQRRIRPLSSPSPRLTAASPRRAAAYPAARSRTAIPPGIVPAEDTGALTLPEAVRGLRIAHCYIADGGELPELDGKLLYSDSSAAWFQLDNNMSTLQNTLNALEKSGCTVTAYEDIGLTLDSRADSWLLIVRNWKNRCDAVFSASHLFLF